MGKYRTILFATVIFVVLICACSVGVSAQTTFGESGAIQTEKSDTTSTHTWSEGRVVTEPTYEAEGEMLYTCAYCNKAEIRKIPRLSVSESEEEAKGDTLPLEPSVDLSKEEASPGDAAEDESSKESGCGSIVGTSSLVIASVFALFAWKKKED